MTPITFTCQHTLSLPPEAIAAGIADTARWPTFTGYGFLPGIASASYDVRPPAMLGARIRVRNTDGSTHVEDITHWEPTRQLGLRLHQFSPPLAHLATHFNEVWLFTPTAQGTHVRRSFELFPRHALARPALWLIAQAFRRAVMKHLREMT